MKTTILFLSFLFPLILIGQNGISPHVILKSGEKLTFDKVKVGQYNKVSCSNEDSKETFKKSELISAIAGSSGDSIKQLTQVIFCDLGVKPFGPKVMTEGEDAYSVIAKAGNNYLLRDGIIGGAQIGQTMQGVGQMTGTYQYRFYWVTSGEVDIIGLYDNKSDFFDDLKESFAGCDEIVELIENRENGEKTFSLPFFMNRLKKVYMENCYQAEK